MTREEVFSSMKGQIVPVVAIKDVAKLPALAEYMDSHDIRFLEVTFRTEYALDAIKYFSANYKNIFVGAGTVLKASQVADAVACGAKFVVSPGYSASVAAECKRLDVLYVPGVESATELMTAIDAGFNFVKFFPAEASGGVKKLKALSAPFGGIVFMPTGGINENNAQDYLALDAVHCIGGTYVLPKELLK